MATLKLKKSAPSATGQKAPGDRQPLRGKGVSRPRQTLAQVQAQREERRAQRDAAPRGDAPAGQRGDERRGERPHDRRDDRREDRREDRRDVRRDGAPERPRRDARPGPASGGFAPGSRGDRGPSSRQADAGWREARPDARQNGRPDGRPDARPDARPQARREADGPRSASRPLRGEFDDRRPAWFDRPAQDDRPNDRPGYAPRADQRRKVGMGGPAQRQASHHDEPSAEGERLSKRMGELGMASRREADEWIAAGWVRVDGKLAQLGQRVGPDVRIEIDPAAHKEQAKRVTILLHKPIGYVSGQAEDGYEPASVLIRSDAHWKDDPSGMKFHIGHARSLAPAGRLDIDSTGLLVLTQDGRIAKLLIGEDSQVEKEYLVRVEYVGIGGERHESGRLPDEDLARLNHGLELDGVQLRPAKVSWANEDQLRFVLREGRKRQIRRMCELVGLKVTALKRVRIGRIPLGHLPPGQWRYLAPWERFD